VSDCDLILPSIYDLIANGINDLFINIEFFCSQSLRSNSYDHHAAIYLLLLERLRARAASGVNPTSTEARTRPSRRPSSVADQALAREAQEARREHHNR
jgi:hypothetical protein